MKRPFILVLLTSTLSSCVTLFNGPKTCLYVHVRPGTQVVYDTGHHTPDTLRPDHKNRVLLEVARNTKPLPITLITDSTVRTIHVTPVHSWLFYSDAWWVYGFFVDGWNPNRFTYPHHVNTLTGWYDTKGYNKRQPLIVRTTEVAIIPPLLHGFFFNPSQQDLVGSVASIGLGLNYHYRDKRFLSVEIGTARGPWVPGERFRIDTVTPLLNEWTSGWHLDARHHNRFGRFDLGYGLSTGAMTGRRYYDRYKADDSVVLSYRATVLGASAAANVRLTNMIYLGMNYMPYLFAFDDRQLQFRYSHMIRFGLYWRLCI